MQTINLNQNSFRLFPTIYMVQNDTGRELKMILDDVTLDGTETGAVAIKRSDGSYYTIAATIDATNNAFDADMTQALTQPSRTECQLKVTASDDTVISTYTFIIMVQPSTDGIQESQLGYSVQQLRQDAEDIRTGGMPADLRLALLQIAQKVAYIDDQGAQYYQDLYDALVPSAILTGISAVYTQSGTVYDTDSLDDLKDDLVVTASYSDGTTETLPASAYTLSGTLEAGTSTVTVSYEDKTATFTVTVTAWDHLDDVAIGGLTYRELFEGSLVRFSINFNDGTIGGFAISAGSPVVSGDEYSTSPYSLKVFGTGSNIKQSVQNIYEANKFYYIPCRVNCSRYSSGRIGMQLSYGNSQNSNCSIQELTTGWQTISLTRKTTTGYLNADVYIGSYSSADLDGYVDDCMVVDVTALASSLGVNTSNAEQVETFRQNMNTAFTEYITIKNGGT